MIRVLWASRCSIILSMIIIASISYVFCRNFKRLFAFFHAIILYSFNNYLKVLTIVWHIPCFVATEGFDCYPTTDAEGSLNLMLFTDIWSS